MAPDPQWSVRTGNGNAPVLTGSDMAKSYTSDIRVHIAGRDLIAGYGVRSVSFTAQNKTHDANAIGAPFAIFDYSRFLEEATFGYTALHDARDEPWLVAKGKTSRTLQGGVTLRWFPFVLGGVYRRGSPSIVAEECILEQHGFQFDAPGGGSPVKIEASGKMSGDVRTGLALEDRQIVGRTGAGGEADREIDLRGASIRWAEPATRANGNRNLNLAVLNSDIQAGRVQVGDYIDIDGIAAAAGVTDYFYVATAQEGNVNQYGTIGVTSAVSPHNAQIWTGAQYAAFTALGRNGGTFHVLRHSASSPAASVRLPHALVVHIQTVTWRDADRLGVRPVFRSAGSTSALGGWQRTLPWVTFSKSAGVTDDDSPYAERFYSRQVFTSEQPTEVALDWQFTDSGGSARNRNDYAFRVIADYVPVSATY